MQLLIMRHGQAEPYAASDADRHLTKVGIEQARSAGDCIKQLGLSFDQVWVSPYVRAQQTADHCLEHSAINVARQSVDAITPDSSPDKLLTIIQQSKADNLLIISHQPLVSIVTGLLVSGNIYAGPAMSPASMVLLECDLMMSGCAEQLWLRHAPTYERSE